MTEHMHAAMDPNAPTVREALAGRMRIDDLAFSQDGARLGLEVGATSGVVIGSFVVVDAPGATLVAQVEELGFVVRTGPEVYLRFDEPVRVRMGGFADGGTVRADYRVLVGGGHVLGALEDGVLGPHGGGGFADAPVRAASDAEVAAVVERWASDGATLEVGSLVSASVPARLVATGFARHTFLCGQSGSGKTYSTGVLLEQVLARTDLRVVVLDPNSDHVHLDEIPSDASSPDAPRLSEVARHVEVVRGDSLRMHVAELEHDLQARLLRLDPLADRAEYRAFRRMLEQAGSFADNLPEPEGVDDPDVRALLQRASNLGVDRWPVWGRSGPVDVLRRIDDDDWRALVVDLGSLGSQHERDAMAAAVLGRLWRGRERRRPVLLVIDEAHNVAPDTTEDPVLRVATDLAVTIAGEGRKFGLHLLVATQRPSKVHPNVVSQCDNLVLMRLNSRTDVEDVARTFSHVPPDLVRTAPTFGLGQALVAGRISPTPQLLRFGARVTPEGGGDVPTDWARPGRT